ncbi:o-succinylbenzoate--CoA ligase [Ectobacillus sp. JY-23]|uniref:o-succinylbenzoate--CoA ligase n=1 Tax=Ectobacillus sp. JY-23 TaxID=2933872 RepID=UPI001FF66451|nr:o-succinylbenzoate--CoA ligase [Ectobacillus sp. JY-23]UOY94385.1 o-succinylbenzoate--CoA ligase [Ectobacillus sp. JY-23]
MNIMPNWLRQRAFLTPNRTALVWEDDALSFLQLYEQVVDIAAKLTALGVKHGDHIGVLMKNSPDMVRVIHALADIGAVAVLLNTRLATEELEWQLQDADVRLLIADMPFPTSIPAYSLKQMKQAPSKLYVSRTEFSLDETMTIIYTSGTTGNPKGVLLTYGNHWWSAIGSALNLGLHERDCWLVCLPFFHVGGLSTLMKSVMYGMTVVLQENAHATQLNEAIRRHEVTMVSVVTKVLTDMVRDLGDNMYPDTLRCVLLGGGPAPRPLLEQCVQKQIPVYQTYGMTETSSQICTLAKDYMLEKIGSAGKPLYPCQLRIDGDSEGEILVKGPNVAAGYHKREHSLEDGWLRTGDIGYLDEDGFLYVLDRRSDLIISGGENIYPAQIEEVLLSHPAVLEAGVVGQADENWGQVPVAFVKAHAVTETELLQFCATKLARYKVPRRIIFQDSLPRGASNKLLRRELKKLCE